jgi:Zn-dependent peptidase ImmA (M78 family)
MLSIQHNYSKEEAESMIKEIRYVFKHLPIDVQKKIDENCLILLLGKTYGYSTGKSNKHLIILNIADMIQDQLSIKEQRFVIAHEFAHFFLNHTRSTDVEENEANNQVMRWGFNI